MPQECRATRYDVAREAVPTMAQATDTERRGCVAVALGLGMMLIGIPMLICPGPGLAMIGAGAAMLAAGLGLGPKKAS